MPELIRIIPKSIFGFDGRANSTQMLVLKDRIPVVAFGSGVLVVRIHSIGTWSSTATATIGVYPESVSPEDPGTEFVITTALASVSVAYDDTTPELLLDTFTADAPMVGILLTFAQGGTAASGSQELTLGVDLVLREVK